VIFGIISLLIRYKKITIKSHIPTQDKKMKIVVLAENIISYTVIVVFSIVLIFSTLSFLLSKNPIENGLFGKTTLVKDVATLIYQMESLENKLQAESINNFFSNNEKSYVSEIGTDAYKLNYSHPSMGDMGLNNFYNYNLDYCTQKVGMEYKCLNITSVEFLQNEKIEAFWATKFDQGVFDEYPIIYLKISTNTNTHRSLYIPHRETKGPYIVWSPIAYKGDLVNVGLISSDEESLVLKITTVNPDETKLIKFSKDISGNTMTSVI